MADLKPFIDRILSSLTLSELIGKYVDLKKSGSGYLGLCPFHSEKSPSFSVNDSKQFYHCFGCGVSGNALTFLMKYKELPFKKALLELSQEAGIPLPENLNLSQFQKAESQREKLMVLNLKAARIYHETLLKTENPARHYLEGQRRLSPEVIRKFYLGYVPDQWDLVLRQLKGAPDKMLEDSGLFSKSKDHRWYDRFRNKIMFPIFDVKGGVIAFGSRVLDNSKPKYINSPETPLFRKKEVLYGLNFSVEEIRKKGFAYVVEGYMDTIALHQAGFQNTVAPLGTAFSEEHIRLLSRYAKEAVLLFDGDEAGKKAAARSVETALSAAFPVKIVTLPENLDPDEFIAEKGSEAFERFLETDKISWEDYLIRPILQESEILLRRKKTVEVLKLFTGKDPVITGLFIEKLSLGLGVSKSDLEAYFKKMNSGAQKRFQESKIQSRENPLPDSEKESRVQRWEMEIVLLLLNNPELYIKNQAELNPAFFSVGGRAYRLFSALIQCFQDQQFRRDLLYSFLDEPLMNFLKNVAFEGKEAEKYRMEPEKQLAQLKVRIRLHYLKGQLESVRVSFAGNPTPELHEELKVLLEQEQKLKKLLSSL